MKKIKVPKFFHELFGKEQYAFEVTLVTLFTIVSTGVVGYLTRNDWSEYNVFQIIVLLVLFVDIAGGVIANLTMGTDQHYHDHSKGRLIFIAIHIQPIILALVLSSNLLFAIGLWAYTMISVLIVNKLHGHVYQRSIAGTFLTTGLIGLYLLGSGLSQVVFIIYLMYLIKVIYSFAVHHRNKEVSYESIS